MAAVPRRSPVRAGPCIMHRLSPPWSAVEKRGEIQQPDVQVVRVVGIVERGGNADRESSGRVIGKDQLGGSSQQFRLVLTTSQFPSEGPKV